MIGKRIYDFELLNSTNEYIKNNINFLNDGDIVLAKEQTSGKGRFGNKWQSPAGNLYFSFILKTKIDRSDVFKIHMRTSVTIINLLKKYKIEARIKYPNDILVNNKKIAGILIESLGYDKIENLIIGIGININQIDFIELKNKATSIKIINKINTDTREVLNEFINMYNSQYLEPDLYEEYRKNLTFLKKTVKSNGKIYQILDIDIKGNILVDTENGPKYLNYTEITMHDSY